MIIPFDIFGRNIELKFKSKKDKSKEELKSPVPVPNEDGATTIEGPGGAGAYGMYLDFEGSCKNEYELISRYRKMALHPECDRAIDEIVNEAIIYEEEKPIVALDMDELEISEKIKKDIEESFNELLILLDFKNEAYNIFRRTYVDGRIYYNTLIDESNPKIGIKELRYIDPRQIKKIREITRTKDQETGADLPEVVQEYYVYNPRGIPAENSPNGTVKMSPEVIVYAHSGLFDEYMSMIISHLHKALKIVNQLSMIEDSLLIYRLSRAPERRIFYIDCGSMPHAKAEDYVRKIMAKYKNKMVYDMTSGEIRDDRRNMSMIEDFWLPRFSGNSGTQIETLKGGENLGQIDDVTYFLERMYKALNVPVSRLKEDSGFTIGRASEISRDEVKFSKLITRLRKNFSILFEKLLEKQLILKNICSAEDWEEWKNNIHFVFQSDSYFSELKESEVRRNRLQDLQSVEPWIGKIFSLSYVKKNILKLTEEEIEDMDKEIKEETKILEQFSDEGDKEETPKSLNNKNEEEK